MMISTRFCPVCGASNELKRAACFACGQVLATGMDEQVGALLHGRYQIGATLGSGGFSAVYRARDLQAGREVAIKQITLSQLSAEEVIEATDTFNREESLLSALHHPQVPQIYDHFNDRDHWYLVLEYLEGPTLETYLETRAAQNKPIQIDEALSIALQLCTVLEYLHTRQPAVIFRDLKPGNIIRAPGGKLSLIDFGIARRFRPGQARDTQRLGSPGYAAPEQYGSAQTTPQTDIYSLGALLHCLLSGQDPAEQLHGLAPLKLDPTGGAGDLVALIQRMLAHEPGDRPADISEVTTALTAIKQQHVAQDKGRIWLPPPPQTPPVWTGSQVHLPRQQGNATPVPPRSRTTRRRVLIGLGTLTAAVAGGGLWWLSDPFQHPHTPIPFTVYGGHTAAISAFTWSPSSMLIASASWDYTVHVWDKNTGNLIYTAPREIPRVSNMAWSPDDMLIALATDNGPIMVWDPYKERLIYTFAQDISNQFGPNATTTVAWSPNSEHIASTSGDNAVSVWNAKDGSNLLIHRQQTTNINAVAWSPSGNWIASGSEDGQVHIWNALTGQNVFINSTDGPAVHALAWSPDSLQVASGLDSGDVRVWDVQDDRNSFTYSTKGDAVHSVTWSPNGQRIVSASDNGTVQIWDAANGSNASIYKIQPDLSVSLSSPLALWSPDGRSIASTSGDNTVKVWDPSRYLQ